jgi:predicted TIM-barrel fold metal-dependent hydrolase
LKCIAFASRDDVLAETKDVDNRRKPTLAFEAIRKEQFMKSSVMKGLLFLCGALMAFAVNVRIVSAQQQAQFTESELKEFTALKPIDIHTHILNSNAAFAAMLKHFNLNVLDIFVGHVVGPGASTYTPETFVSRKQDSWRAVRSSGGRAKLSTAFPRVGWDDPGFAQSAVSSINEDFAQGAKGVTIWTNSVTQFKDASGKFALADDPKLEPIYKDMIAHDIPLISHTALLDETWVPDPAAVSSGEPAALAARDHVLEQNPKLRVVAAHLGSYKEEMDKLTSRLEQYPNLAVDTAGRMDYLMGLPKEQAQSFILKFQDRILYGSDNAFYETDPVDGTLVRWQSRYVLDWRYLSGDGEVDYRGRQVQCLKLPKAVLRKLYHDNSVHWVPRISAGG